MKKQSKKQKTENMIEKDITLEEFLEMREKARALPLIYQNKSLEECLEIFKDNIVNNFDFSSIPFNALEGYSMPETLRERLILYLNNDTVSNKTMFKPYYRICACYYDGENEKHYLLEQNGNDISGTSHHSFLAAFADMIYFYRERTKDGEKVKATKKEFNSI